MSSPVPPTSVATSGVSIAIASSTAFGVPSRSDDCTNMSNAWWSAMTSVRWPSSRTEDSQAAARESMASRIGAQAPFADDRQLELRVSGVEPANTLKQQVEALLRLQASDGADDDVVRLIAQFAAASARAVPDRDETRFGSMALLMTVTRSGREPVRTSSALMWLATAITRGNRASRRFSTA